MCGIFGITFNRDHIMSNKKDQLKILIKELFEATEYRGKVATGIAAMNEDKVTYMKQKICASDFVEKPEFNGFLDDVLCFEDAKTNSDGPICSIIGHCRLDTKGSPDRNVNNHPIVSGNMIGIHNGGVSNDEELHTQFKDRFKTKRLGEVDSEIIFRLIDYFYNSGIKSCTAENRWEIGVASIQRASQWLTGGFSCAMINNKEPYRLYLFRNFLPMAIRYYTTLGITVFASVDSFITMSVNNVFGKELNANVDIAIPQKSGVLIDVDHNKYYNFDLEENKQMSVGK